MGWDERKRWKLGVESSMREWCERAPEDGVAMQDVLLYA